MCSSGGRRPGIIAWLVRHRNAAEQQQDHCTTPHVRQMSATLKSAIVLQVNKVDDGAAAEAGWPHQPVTQVPDGSCQQQAECCRPAHRAEPGGLGDDQHGDRHRHAGEQHRRSGAKPKAAPEFRET